jgi:hypothetical protein
MTRRRDALSGASLLSRTVIVQRAANGTVCYAASQDEKLRKSKLHFLSYCPRAYCWVLHTTRRFCILSCDVDGANASPLCGLTRSSCDGEIFRRRNVNLFALRLILRFSRKMIRADKSGSKLCADNPRHAQGRRPSAARLRSTWQGAGFALPVASPPVYCVRRAETLPFSAPLDFRARFASRSRVVHP